MPATVDSLGTQLREVLPARRLQSVSLCDHEANVLWLSEGALGPDEHMLVMEALEVLKADSSLPCHETALEDGRLSVFLPVRAPTGALVGVAMILADSKSVGDDTLERLTAAPVRTIMQRLAVLLKPSGQLGAIAVELPEELSEPAAEAIELEATEPEPTEQETTELETAEVEAIEVVAFAAATAEPPPDPEPVVRAAASVVELSLVTEVEIEVAPTPTPTPTPMPPPAPKLAKAAVEDDSDPVISAAEIASILELELAPEDLKRASPKPAAPAAPAAAAPPVLPAASADEDDMVADSGMLRLEFLAEPPVVRPAQNPTVVARKLQAASKAAEVAPTRAPRALPPPTARAPAATSAPPAAPAPPATAAAAKGNTPTSIPLVKAVPGAPPAIRPAPLSAGGMRHPFEPVPPHSRLSLNARDEDVVVLFESEPLSVPQRAATPAKGAPAKVPPVPQGVAPAKVSAPKPAAAKAAATAQPARIQPAVRIAPPARSAPAVRNVPPPAPVAIPVVAAAPVVMPAPSAPERPSPAIDLVPFARLRAGGQNRRFQVQPRDAAAQRDPAADEQLIQDLLAWLGSHRSLWTSVPTTFTVNLSIATLEDERFLGKVGAALNTHGISGDTLGFEIAESLCAQQRVKVERFIAQCEKIGAWVAIDDFSFDSQVLPLLRSKALRLLKLDARLTAAALRDKLSQAMLVASVQAAKVLGIHCSAKKTDSQASLQYLTAIGLDYAQGTALAAIVPIEHIGTLLGPRPGAPEEIQ